MTTPTLFCADTPRTRTTDPLESHAAGDLSQQTTKLARNAVLLLVMQEGELGGSEINRLYALRQERMGWPRVAADTPRKRSGDLLADGLLEVVTHQKAIRLQERIFTITEQGKREIGVQ